MSKKSLWERALGTALHSRFVARADDLGHPLTDDEVRSEAYKGLFEDDRELYRKTERQLKALLK